MDTRQITVNIPTAYCDTFVKMFDGMGFEYHEKYTKPRKKAPQKPEPDSKEYILNSICQGMKEVRLWEQGKLKLKSAEEVLREL